MRRRTRFHKWVLMVTVALLEAGYAATQPDFNEAKDYLNRGIAYGTKGQLDQAISSLTKALEINPHYADAYYNRGFAYASKGQYDEAISDYNKVLEINPRDAEAYGSRGLAYAGKGQYEQAISDYNKVLEINPRDAKAYNNRGNAYASKGQYDEAISDYNKVLEINPRDAEVYVNRGLAYARKDQYDQAISDFSHALNINSAFAEAYHNRAGAYYYKKEYDKAWDDVYKAKSLGFLAHPAFLKALSDASGRASELTAIGRKEFPHKKFSVDSPPVDWEMAEQESSVSWTNRVTRSVIQTIITAAPNFSYSTLAEMTFYTTKVSFQREVDESATMTIAEQKQVRLNGNSFYQLIVDYSLSPAVGMQVKGKMIWYFLMTDREKLRYQYILYLMTTLQHHETDRLILDQMAQSFTTLP